MFHIIEHTRKHILFVGDDSTTRNYKQATIHDDSKSIYKLLMKDVSKDELSDMYYKREQYLTHCEYCKEEGHSRIYCPKYKKDQLHMYHTRAEHIINSPFFKKFSNEFCTCKVSLVEDPSLNEFILDAKICYYCEFACCEKATNCGKIECQEHK